MCIVVMRLYKRVSSQFVCSHTVRYCPKRRILLEVLPPTLANERRLALRAKVAGVHSTACQDQDRFCPTESTNYEKVQYSMSHCNSCDTGQELHVG
jgi:hypothetical protein